MKLSTAPDSGSFVAENRGFDKSRADTENKKGFLGSHFVSPIKNAARHIADGIRTVFRNIRSFLIAVCSPPCSCFRKEKSAAPGQESPASVERGEGQVQRDASSRPAETHEQSALAKPVSQDTDDLSALSGRVKSVSSDQGIEGFIKRRVFENPYGVVNFIDASGELLNDAGCAIKRLAGSDASTPSDISSGAAARPVPLSSGETPAASPSAGTPECASIAGADAMIREGADQALQVDAASSQVDVAGDVTTLPGNAKIVISDRGIADFIMRKGFEKTYEVVNTIDRAGSLVFGVTHDIRKLADNDCARVTMERRRSMRFSDRLAHGQSATDDFRCGLSPSRLDDKGYTIHDVPVPCEDDPDFEKHLKSSFLMIFEKSGSRGTGCIVFPVPGSGRVGEGSQLAQVIFDARREFASKHPYCQPPGIILASTSSCIDRRACKGFGNKWRELHNQQKVSGQSVTEPGPASRTREPDVSTPSDISSEAAARPVHWPSGKTPADLSSGVIPESAFPAKTGKITRKHTGQSPHQIRAAVTRAAPHVQHPPAGRVSQNVYRTRGASMVIRDLTSKAAFPVALVYNTGLKPFIENRDVQSQKGDGFVYGVVSPVDETGRLQHSIASLVKDMAGDGGACQTIMNGQNEREGPCPLECGRAASYPFSSKDETRQSSDLNNWHSVLCARFPHASAPDFDRQLASSILELLGEADQDGLTQVIFPFLSDDKEIGITAGQWARALYDASHFFLCQFGKMPPKVFLVGMDTDVLVEGGPDDEDFRAQWSTREKQQEAREPKSSNPYGARPRDVFGTARITTWALAETGIGEDLTRL